MKQVAAESTRSANIGAATRCTMTAFANPRTLLLILSATIAAAFPAQAKMPSPKEAEVTFYAKGSIAKAILLPYTKRGAFWGTIFDGNQWLAVLPNGRFLTVRVPAGRHLYSASLSKKHPAKNALLPLDLEAGKQYFIRVDEEYKGAIVVFDKGRLDEVPCQIARQEGGTTKPVQQKYIAPSARPEVVADTSMPPCS